MKVFDLFCGVGGASVGIARVLRGARIIGFDIAIQPNYPYEFRQVDVTELTPDDLRGVDFIWASPPCQRYSKATPKGARNGHPDLVASTQKLLKASGVPYVIENVDGAPIRRDVWLCGQMFPETSRLYRHRRFECSFPVVQPAHPWHLKYVGWTDEDIVTVAGHGAGCPSDLYTWQSVMGMPWPQFRSELAEAIPPAYAEYIARQYVTA